jgi:hypothetical protein
VHLIQRRLRQVEVIGIDMLLVSMRTLPAMLLPRLMLCRPMLSGSMLSGFMLSGFMLRPMRSAAAAVRFPRSPVVFHLTISMMLRHSKKLSRNAHAALWAA